MFLVSSTYWWIPCLLEKFIPHRLSPLAGRQIIGTLKSRQQILLIMIEAASCITASVRTAPSSSGLRRMIPPYCLAAWRLMFRPFIIRFWLFFSITRAGWSRQQLKRIACVPLLVRSLEARKCWSFISTLGPCLWPQTGFLGLSGIELCLDPHNHIRALLMESPFFSKKTLTIGDGCRYIFLVTLLEIFSNHPHAEALWNNSCCV